ncbi:MAG: Histone deacetylase/AcuC/AphA family protein [Deltaproteobacteria bacterium]|nr:Histone deacetylase/AcuC/AphA family protein [Deltaproteobacteria bacterium]
MMSLNMQKMLDILIYSADLARSEYSSSHPFKPMRAKLLVELLNRFYLMFEDNQKIIEPVPANEELLYLFHDRQYIEVLKKADAGEFTMDMLWAELGTGDNPIFKGMYDFVLTVAGATCQGANMLLDDGVRMAFNPVGGLHHAGRDHAEGFCYVNDIAIAVTDLVSKGKKIAYLDIDAHHGNGVQDAFYRTDKVLTISLHESGETLYPGTGFEKEIGEDEGRGYTVNVPFRSGTDDEVYLFAFEAVVPPLMERFKPDILVAQIGGDSHKDDPLANLNLTSNGYKRMFQRMNGFAPKLLALGGGGYNVFKTAALWTIAWAVFCGLEPVDQYAGLVGGMMFGPEAEAGNLDDAPYVLEGEEKEACFEQARRVVDYLQKTVFPIHGIT